MTESKRGEAPALRLEDVHLHLESGAGTVNILRGLDLRVERGETVGIVGPSGSGKTTMMMAIAGLERINSGLIEVAGADLSTMDEDDLARFRRERVGIVFQSFHLVPTMTALENVAVPLELAGRRDGFEKAERRLAAVGLAERTAHYPGQLSGGEQQRVAIARATVADPAVLLADEPTGNLDGDTGERVISLLFDEAKANGSTLLLVTHDRTLAARCDRTIRIADGRVVDEETPVAA